MITNHQGETRRDNDFVIADPVCARASHLLRERKSAVLLSLFRASRLYAMEALRLIDSAPPDLVVLDLGLPHVTGQDVLYELKEHAHTREIPVLVVTGRDSPVPGVDTDCVLMKPVHAAELVRQVRRCLGLEAEGY